MPAREHLLKIGVSGIRGVVGEFLTPALATAFGQAFGSYVGRGRVVVGRDTRSSGPALQHATQCGLLAAGCEVVDVGVLPTPTVQMYVEAISARGGISLTASHNPPEYNALKLFNEQGLFLNTYERGELLELYHQSEFYHAPNSEIGEVCAEKEAPRRLHIERVLRQVNADTIKRTKFRVGLDCVNGAGSVMTPGFLADQLGCDVRAMSIDPTKPFPRVAEPRPDTLGDIASLVRRDNCAIGFAQDPDGDRLAIVDEQGNVLDNDDVLALVVQGVLARYPGPVVVNLTTSSVIDDIAEAFHRRVYRAAVGEANVVEMMQAVDAVIGGEGSNGGIIYPAVHLCRDSYTGMAFVLEQMAESGKTISQLVAQLPRYTRLSGKVEFGHGRLGLLMQGLEDAFAGATIDRADGLKLLWPDAWIHVRASNTEPLLRLAVEARAPERAKELFEKVQGLAT